jgi:hypothetical protein
VTLSEQLPSLRRSVPPAREVAAARAAYIGFFNTVWLVLNDMIVGQALGRLIGANERSLTDGLAWAIKVPPRLRTSAWVGYETADEPSWLADLDGQVASRSVSLARRLAGRPQHRALGRSLLGFDRPCSLLGRSDPRPARR